MKISHLTAILFPIVQLVKKPVSLKAHYIERQELMG